MAKDFKNIKKGALLSKLGKLKKPNPNDTELSLMEELLDSTDDDAPWFYNPDEFNWNARNQLEIKTRESNVDDVIRGFKSVSPSKKGTGEKSYALYKIGTKKVKIEATKKGLSDLSASTITKMQERGAAVVFERAIKDNVKFKDAQAIVKDKETYDRLLEIWQKEGEDIVDMEWIKSFYKMTCTLMAKVSPRNIEEFDRDAPNGFMEYITKNFDSIEELEKAAEYREEDERKYWIARMGKQAAIDIYANGRIGIGNMDSIAMMAEEDQIYAVNIAMQYAGLLNTGISKIQNELKPQLDKLLSDGSEARFPTFDRIEDNLNLNLFNKISGKTHEQKSLQSPDQSETE